MGYKKMYRWCNGYCTRVECDRSWVTEKLLGCVMVSVLDSSVIDHGLHTNCIGGVMVSVLDSSVRDHGLQKNCSVV